MTFKSFIKSLFFLFVHLIFFYIYLHLLQKKVITIAYETNSPYLLFKSDSKQISIVIPIYNRLIYLNDTLNSALSQNISIPNGIEIICVDDCSSENTTKLITGRMQQNPRIKLIQHFYHQGTFHARKHGIYFSTGKYIMSLDSDDFFYENALEQLYQFTQEVDADVIDFVAQAGKRRRLYTLDWNPCVKNITNSNSEVRRGFLNDSLGFNVWKVMVKRSVFVKALNFISPFFENKQILYAEDVAFLGGVFLFSSNFYCTKFRVYVHYMFTHFSVEKGAVQKKDQNHYQLVFVKDAMKYLYKEIEQRNGDVSLKDMLSKDVNVTMNYQKIPNIVRRRIRMKCETRYPGFIVRNDFKNGFCTMEKY